jgi:hypothetical protein
LVLGLLLLGASIVLAGQAFDRGGSVPGSSPAGAASGPPPAPTLLQPSSAITGSAAVDVSGTLPAGLAGAADYVLRIYRDDRLVRERPLPASSPWTLHGLDLHSGDNTFTAAIAGPGGESLHSAPITITLDDQPPVLDLVRPTRASSQTTAASATIAVRTVAGAAVRLTVRSTGKSVESVAGADGRFSTLVDLARGRNSFDISATNELGNTAKLRVVIERVTSLASVALTVEPDLIRAARLPQTIDLVAAVVDSVGRPADGAQVTFSVSPPGQPTATYTTTSVKGVARWTGFRLLAGPAATGRGGATVLVILANGEQLTDFASFSVR